jgi:hypothetical protein
VTEKIMHAFGAGCIPIYWGTQDVLMDFNPKAFINANDYKTFEGVIERIKEIDNNDELYLDMVNQPIFSDRWNNIPLFFE